jgi:hypothetical protein
VGRALNGQQQEHPAIGGVGVHRSRPVPWEDWVRIGFWVVLILSWAVLVGFMWDALTTVPDADRLQQTRMAVIPTHRTFFAAMAFSALELGVVLALLWPWRPAYYTARLAAASLALATWFTMTIPMGLSRMDWVHRRWLAFLVAVTAAALAASLIYRLARRLHPQER